MNDFNDPEGLYGIASVYSFNVESELFHQLNQEQQKLWRKEIENAVKFGINYGIRNII